jgi:dynein heavy chain
VEALIEDITQKKEKATVQQNEASAVKKKLDEDAVIIERERKEADIALQRAEPAVQAAQDALKEVNAKDLNEVKALANPPDTVVRVCTIAFYLKFTDLSEQKKDDWGNVRNKFLGNLRLLQELQDYKINTCKAEMAKNAKRGLAELRKKLKLDGEELAAAIKNTSKSAAGIYKWAAATDQYYDIFKEVEPKKKRAQEMKAQSERSEAALKKTQEELAELQMKLNKLERELKAQQDELDDLMEKQAIA